LALFCPLDFAIIFGCFPFYNIHQSSTAMRFGRDVHLHQIPEWADFYIDYNGLKSLLKLATKTAVEQQRPADLTGN
jgi:hypothetical protein